jgi:hypothetical protein
MLEGTTVNFRGKRGRVGGKEPRRKMSTDYRRLIQPITGGNDELVFQFFGVFSRFEYALKRSGLLMKTEKAKPDWGTYADKLRGRFAKVQNKAFQDAVTFLLKEPPKTQVATGNNLDFKDTLRGDKHDERYVLDLVKTVRNNLFHGGKYPLPNASVTNDALHNNKLLEACLVILNECLSLYAPVKHFYEEEAS